MSERNSTLQQRRAFGNAVAVALSDARLDVEALFSITGADKPESARRTVHRWITGEREPARPQVREIEQRLGVASGSLSAYLGFVPVDSARNGGAELAITVDPELTVEQRNALLNVLRTFKRDQRVTERTSDDGE